jgi:hypothetical protein
MVPMPPDFLMRTTLLLVVDMVGLLI